MASSKSAPSVLIVDDEVEVREFLQELVKDVVPKAAVFQAANGAEAITKLQNQRFSLLITDMSMPRMSGASLIQAAKSLPMSVRPEGYFAISGNQNDSSVVSQFGDVSFFAKPLNRESLKAHLGEYFGLSAPKAQSRSQIDVNFINPFIEGALIVLRTSANVEAKKEAVFVRGGDQISGDISALIAMNSQEYLGSMAISFTERCFLEVVSGMLGEPYKVITPDIQDAAAEICNQIFGFAKKVLNERGHSIQPAIPSVISGAGHTIKHVVGGTCVGVKFTTPGGSFQIEAAMQSRV